MPKRPGRLHVREDGQGLVELIVALTVLAIGIGALLTILTSSALSLQRSGQKGTALALAEKQIELYRNLVYADIRLDHNMPLVDSIYSNAYLSDPKIPLATGERTDSTPGTNPCDTSAECRPVQYVGPGYGTPTPDHRKYRIDTYIDDVTPSGGDAVAQVYVVVRNAQVAGYPILARSASTISAINIANQNGKQIVSMAFSAQRAALQNTTPDATAITATLSGGVNETGQVNFYVLKPPSTPSPPCPSASWTAVDSVNVSGNGDYHPSAAALANVTFTTTGTYYWYAAYTGDPVNKKASSLCGATTQSTTVRAAKLSPTLTLSSAATAIVNQPVPGSSITATVAGSSGYTPNTLKLMAYGPTNTPPSTCTTTPGGLWQAGGSVSPNGDGSFSPSATFTPTATGRYWWYASYPGDGTNNAAASRCDGSTSIAHIDVATPPDTFSLVSLSGASQTAGTAFSVRITAILPNGSGPDTAYSGSKTLTYSGPATSPKGNAPSYPATATFTSGIATVSVTLYTAETASITATQGLVTGTSSPITVAAKPTAGFSITSVGTQTAGAAFGATLTAIDQYGNPSSDYPSTSHTINFSGPANAPNGQKPDYNGSQTTETVPFTAGVGTVANIKLYKASTSTTLTATDAVTTTIKGTSAPFTVKGGTPQTMTFINCSQPTAANTGCAGQPISTSNKTMTANVGLLDTWGNAASATSNVTIGLASSGGGVTVTSSVNVPQGSTQSTQLTVGGNNAAATITASATGFSPVTLQVQK